MSGGLIAFEGPIWRIMFADQADAPFAPARAPEGRFHHSGQPALYASLSAEGAGVAIQRYLGQDDPPRVILKMQARLGAVSDRRGETELSVVWQEIRASGAPAPSWAYSDAARSAGAEALLYSSRSRPDLGHICLLDWTAGMLRIEKRSKWPA